VISGFVRLGRVEVRLGDARGRCSECIRGSDETIAEGDEARGRTGDGGRQRYIEVEYEVAPVRVRGMPRNDCVDY